MNVNQASERLEISPSLCYQLCQEGRLGHARIGARGRRGKIVISVEDVERFLASVKAEPAAAPKAAR